MITICFTYFRNLSLTNLAAALYSISKQDLSRVERIVIVDNNTDDASQNIQNIISSSELPTPVMFISTKHGDLKKTHAWSTNFAVARAETPWVFFTRADYLLDFDVIKKFVAVIDSRAEDWDGFIVSNGRHLGQSVERCEQFPWRSMGPHIFNGVDYDYTEIDSGVWMMRTGTFHLVGGLDERLSAWGHSQTEFQHRVYLAGIEFVRIKETLFFHPSHGGSKDIDLANLQLTQQHMDLRSMWARYHGVSPYGR